jgi:acetylornithine/succinyldiaminopimelate/putrescine aminotransferase
METNRGTSHADGITSTHPEHRPVLPALEELRGFGPQRRTIGLPDDVIERFARRDDLLRQAIEEAVERHRNLRRDHAELMELDEEQQVERLQDGFANFYAHDAVNPYVPLAARGPWVVTSKGAVLHDSGGYGMLGLGHSPDEVIDVLGRPQVMANVMTASFGQLRLASALRREIGQRRPDGCPFARFICLNSGSEAMTVALRLSDINAKKQTDPDGPHAGKPIKAVALAGGFHGRTDRPAQFSHSTRKVYLQHLASFRDRDNLITVEANAVDQLRAAFGRAEKEGWFIEAVLLEPVMGEGNPGMAVKRDFYHAARELTRQHGGVMIVDSIQAGLRAHGYLSIVDYPGFEDAEIPDIETYSKALNAGQYPLSVLALSQRAAGWFQPNVYGNTMTTNPRAMDVACSVLERMTPELRENIRARGREMIDKLQALAGELGGAITRVQGTGLLLSAELSPDYKCFGAGSVEEWLRIHGIGVIHGGKNSLRYTPHFAVTSDEVDLMVRFTREALLSGAGRAG